MKKHIAEDLPARSHPQAQLSSQNKKPESKDSGRDGDKGGEKTPEQRIRQAVYDIRYRARREKLPLRTAYSQFMQNSSMSEPEKAEVRKKLFGDVGGSSDKSKKFVTGFKKPGMQAEDFSIDMKRSASNAVSNALYKVFLEKKDITIDLDQLKYELEEMANDTSDKKKYKVRVTDKESGVTYVRYATREKISQLRAKGLEVEMTEYGTPYEGERTKGEKTAEVLSKRKKPNDGNLANNYPPYDKVTRGDVVSGRLGKDQMGGKNVKEDFLGEVSAMANLPQTDASQGVNPDSNTTQIDFTTKKNKIVVNPTDKSQTKLMAQYEIDGNNIFENGYSKFLKKVHSLQEKSESEQQQKLFGLALSVKRGETPRSEVSQAVLDIVDKMSEKEIRKFAKTKHEGIPKKKMQKEEVSCGENGQDKVDRRPLETAINLAKNKVRAMGSKNPVVMVASELPTLQKAQYDPEGEVIGEEMPRLAKGKPSSGTVKKNPKKPKRKTPPFRGYYDGENDELPTTRRLPYDDPLGRTV
jgi:hypothetical protein